MLWPHRFGVQGLGTRGSVGTVTPLAPVVMAVARSPFTTGAADDAGWQRAAFRPDGTFLAITNNEANSVSMLSVGEDGTLAPVSQTPTPAGPVALAFSPDGSLLAVVNATTEGSGSVAMYSVGSDGGQPDQVLVFSVASDGTLSPVPGSPFATGQQPTSVAFSPDGGLVAVPSFIDDESARARVSIYGLAAQGQLVPVQVAPTGSHSASIAFSAGGLLAVGNLGEPGSVSVFSVLSGGELSEAPGSPTPLEGPQGVAFSPDGALLAVTGQGRTLRVFFVGPDGALTPAPGSPFPSGDPNGLPFSVAFSHDGRWLAMTNCPYPPLGSGTVSLFSVREPMAQIASPAPGTHHAVGQPVPTSFSCNSPSGDPPTSCVDSNGSTSGTGTLETRLLGGFGETREARS
jgi:6-phosphogluconolactonase (cycloisomerase 2 family)